MKKLIDREVKRSLKKFKRMKQSPQSQFTKCAGCGNRINIRDTIMVVTTGKRYCENCL